MSSCVRASDGLFVSAFPLYSLYFVNLPPANLTTYIWRGTLIGRSCRNEPANEVCRSVGTEGARSIRCELGEASPPVQLLLPRWQRGQHSPLLLCPCLSQHQRDLPRQSHKPKQPFCFFQFVPDASFPCVQIELYKTFLRSTLLQRLH